MSIVWWLVLGGFTILIIVGIVGGIVMSRNKSGKSGTASGTSFKFNNVGSTYWIVDQYNDSNPTLRVNRGATYTFRRVSEGHPLSINDKSDQYITDGINGQVPVLQGNDLVWTVPTDADSEYYYRCTKHASMQGRIEVNN